VTEHPREDTERLIRGFLAQAYRRRVQNPDAKQFTELFHHEFEPGTGSRNRCFPPIRDSLLTRVPVR
jgi:hypothetical protein